MSEIGSSLPGLGLLAVRRLIDEAVVARFQLAPGDQPLVASGDRVTVGMPLASHLRDATVRDLPPTEPEDDRDRLPGAPWDGTGGRSDGPGGERLFELAGRWRVVAGELVDTLEAPLDGSVDEIITGAGITLRTRARGICGALVLGSPVRGRLVLGTSGGGELRSSMIDVGLAGQILVAGARIAAEALTRARAMGVRGIVVGSLSSKERRDYLASEARQRAARQRLPPFAVLVLGGSLRRPIAGPLMALLQALDGHDVAILPDPAVLAVDDPAIQLPLPPADLLRVRSGPLAGVEGHWAGLGGLRRFPGGAHLETGLLRVGDAPAVALPLGDLERFG